MRPQERTAEAEVAAAVFQHAHIPRKLDEVADFERDAAQLKAGDDSHIFYQTLAGLAPDGSHAATGVPQVLLSALRSQHDADACCSDSQSLVSRHPDAVALHAAGGAAVQQHVTAASQPPKHAAPECAHSFNLQPANADASDDESHSGSRSSRSSRSSCRHHSGQTSSRSGSSSSACCDAQHAGAHAQRIDACQATAAAQHRKDVARPTLAELKAARKEHKQAVKADRAEKRAHKVPKKVKKAAEKKGKHKK